MTLSSRTRSVKEVADFVQARVLGDGTVQLTGISSVHSAAPGDLVFVDDEKNLSVALKSPAAAVIVGGFAQGKKSPKPLLLAAHPRLAFARAAQLLRPRGRASLRQFHPSAIVRHLAQLANGVTIDERVVVVAKTHCALVKGPGLEPAV